ncbi:uncharacterized protein LOC115765217 [Drosophila novamexicana]|uniref:uncharacterized protein LOC115765217 n=1 Tax=Drosophila novamexicana TaxID=47314 RepID=UPI0011E5EB9B|nr:uncharacterized protein LOC115765217 [Drosophila novamexicana]
MVGRLGVKIWLSLLAILLARTEAEASLRINLPTMVLQQLNGSSSQFEEWTKRLSERLSPEQQQRLAWNVAFLETPKSPLQLRQLQNKLSPNSSINNPLKLRLWISFYWQLRRSNRLGSNKILLPHFALTLRQLQGNPMWRSAQLTNMLQSLPNSLGVLVRSRWLCLKHDRDQLYALPGEALMLGANSNCCMWQLVVADTSQAWLRLENACEVQATWFINILQQTDSGTYTLQSAPSDNSSSYCIRNGASYLVEVQATTDTVQNQQALGKDCHWELNDCTQLPTLLNRYFKG